MSWAKYLNEYNLVLTKSLCVPEFQSWSAFALDAVWKPFTVWNNIKEEMREEKRKENKKFYLESNDFQSWLTSLQPKAEQICQFCYIRTAWVCNMRIWVCAHVCIMIINNENYSGSLYTCVQSEQVDGKLWRTYFLTFARLFVTVLGIVSSFSIIVQWWAAPKKHISDLRVNELEERRAREAETPLHTDLEQFQCQTCFGTERAGSHHSNACGF